MKIRLKPIATAVFFSIGGSAYASAGGSNGENGSSSGNRNEIIGNVLFGISGTAGNGGDVEDIIQDLNFLTVSNESIGGARGSNGNNGTFVDTSRMEGAFSYGAGGGAGGSGGASVISGISIGGSAGGTGYLNSNEKFDSNGGNGGFIKNTTIKIDKSKFFGEGAFGGNGGDFMVGDVSEYIGGGAGHGGHGGGAVSGGISIGGSAGFSSSFSSSDNIGNKYKANGGSGGDIRNATIKITDSYFLGGDGGDGGDVAIDSSFGYYLGGGGGGGGGNAGASVFGGVSMGGSAGHSKSTAVRVNAYAIGGEGGSIEGNDIYIVKVELNGKNASGGNGGSSIDLENGNVVGGNGPSGSGSGGHGGHGGGSVFGGISTGGSTGTAHSFYGEAIAAGGGGGTVARNKIYIKDAEFHGGNGGRGGNGISGGNGGGSVFGGISAGGAGGYAYTSGYSAAYGFYGRSNGGNGGDVEGNLIEIYNSFIYGGEGGEGGVNHRLEKVLSGFEGGSVFGGVSTGGSGGYVVGSSLLVANGGKGGNVQNNNINIGNSSLKGSLDVRSFDEYKINGGSIFGGISRGGNGGGYIDYVMDAEASGGDGGNVIKNKITISGETYISGDIYGGYSIGGSKGSKDALSFDGKGGFADFNTITLIGSEISILGSVYGGLSVNGDGEFDNTKAFRQNTLNLEGYKGAVQGIYNIENYNWTLPVDVFKGETIIEIMGDKNVKLDNTKHTIAMYNDGSRLNVGDELVMISKAEGDVGPRDHRIVQGHFLVYDATLEIVTNNDNPTESKLVLSIVGKEDSTPGEPAGTIPDSSKKFLVSRAATMATLNQGADMVREYLVAAMDDTCGNKLFGVVNGGSYRTNTGSESHIKLHDVSMAFGGVNCFELQNKSTVMLSAFVEHGKSNYDSYNNFTNRGDVHGWGDVQYTGAGLLLHMNVAGTGSKPAAPAIGTKDGLYLNAALSVGRAKTSFDSTLLDSQGVRGNFDSKSRYVAAMVGAGYAWKLDEKQWLDFYGRYNWGYLGSDSVMIGNARLSLDTMKSSRLSFSARYHYAVQKDVTPYVGVEFEREFTGHAYGRAYDMSIDHPSLKGNSGVVEVGVNVKPSATNKAWTVNMGVQGAFGNRRGISGGVGLKYVF